jgi:hypothetical protein
MAQCQERREKVNHIKRATSRRSDLLARFRLLTRFANHRMTRSGLGMKAFRSSRCFSTQLRWTRGCSYMTQKGGHGPSHLRQRRFPMAGFPRSEASLHQRASQDQQIVRARDHLRPALSPLRGTQPWHIPEQFLLIEAIAMLMRIAQAIRGTDLGQRSRTISLPDKPTDPRITRFSTCSMTDDLDNRHLGPAGGAQVQVGPTSHLNFLAFGVESFPTFVRRSMSLWIATLKALPILASGSPLPSKTCWSRTVKDAIAFDAQQTSRPHIGLTCQKGRATNPATTDRNWRAATSVASSFDFTRVVSNTKVP